MAAIIPAILVMSLGVAVAAPPPNAVTEISFLMPQVQPQDPDTYLCKAMKVEEAHKYITGFVPTANANIAHHILLYGCEYPGGDPESIWDCGEMSTTTRNYQKGSVCAEGSRILYAWAMEAPRLNLPPDVSFDVGQKTPIKYLVLQVHYKNVTSFKPPLNQKDSSGLTLITTQTATPKEAGVYLMVTDGVIRAHTTEYFEVACEMPEDIEIIPFAYRTHAHTLGRVISGYRVRDGKWTEIGRKDPRLPEMFYNVTNPGITIKKGDILAARCTMENTLDHDVAIGSTQNDEMCNFYIMYYVNTPPTLQQDVCSSYGPPTWYWEDFEDQKAINLKAQPSTISVIPGADKPLIKTKQKFYSNPLLEARDEELEEMVPSELSAEEIMYLLQKMDAERQEGERSYLPDY
ncbi:probable peptidylglycine alpha-hydroxylating monooxygenase 1 [Physella acuta]|uniref:probable peptidylglycine alpha-hydroxylating monooxygenase 1 n=1 Tax=Physella acuta TaxID=109671 RepID=UPI0027DC71E4|nr:probable peptidylglycine alpha-hydroxylating monooxygenase 1 [Physella acuta]XP_059165123.1 probable peptidylglycine alpha-hydroxylating monooxygenase 1 [Physella acuta]